MRALADYLGIGSTDAREQFHRLLDRPAPAPGKRQEAFEPVETLLCLAASLLVDHRRYGSTSAPRAAEPVPTLARLFRRPNSSVLAKMANLDGSRSNGARHDQEVGGLVLETPGLLSAVYRAVLAGARQAGVDAVDLPDFLGLEHDDADFTLLGQEELDRALVEQEVQGRLPALVAAGTEMEQVTQRWLVMGVRVGQHRFARQVLAGHGHRCVFCGLAVGGKRMLLAGHIKPWRDSDHAERLDPANGVTACPTHDVAFDTGLITANGGLRIHVLPDLARAALTDPATRAAFGRPPLHDRLAVPAGTAPPGEKYLRWHHEHVYQGALP